MNINNELTPAFERIVANVLLKANARSGQFFSGDEESLSALVETEASEVMSRLPKEEVSPVARLYSKVFTERPVSGRTQSEVALDNAKKDLVVAVYDAVVTDLITMAA